MNGGDGAPYVALFERCLSGAFSKGPQAVSQKLAKENLRDLIEARGFCEPPEGAINEDKEKMSPIAPTMPQRRHSDPKPCNGRRIRRLSEPAM